MAKVDLGTKRVCPECGARFYDLNRSPATCPECGSSFNPEELAAGSALAAMKDEPLKDYDADSTEDDADEDAPKKSSEEEDEDDIDEAEAEAKELELDGDDAAIIGGSDAGDEEPHDMDGFSEDEDTDADAALVDDEDNELPPPDAEDVEDDDVK